MGSGTNKVAAMLVGNSMGYEIDLELQIQTTITTFWYILSLLDCKLLYIKKLSQ